MVSECRSEAEEWQRDKLIMQEVKETDEIERPLSDCESALDIPKSRGGPGFNDWEKEFLGSIREQFDDKGWLTSPQVDKLRQLWDRI
jgi:hypothetical protein